MANTALGYEQAQTHNEGMTFLDPFEVIRNISTLDDETLVQALEPLATRLAQSPEAAAKFIKRIIDEAIDLGIELNPLISSILESHLLRQEITAVEIENTINEISANQYEMIEFFKGLNIEAQRLLSALYIYLQINRGISVDEYFEIAKKLNLPRLPKELWDVRRFGVSNMGHKNHDVPASLEFTPEEG